MCFLFSPSPRSCLGINFLSLSVCLCHQLALLLDDHDHHRRLLFFCDVPLFSPSLTFFLLIIIIFIIIFIFTHPSPHQHSHITGSPQLICQFCSPHFLPLPVQLDSSPRTAAHQFTSASTTTSSPNYICDILVFSAQLQTVSFFARFAPALSLSLSDIHFCLCCFVVCLLAVWHVCCC